MEISSTFWWPHITEWWRQWEETHSKSGRIFNVGRNILSIIPHGVGVEASFCLGKDEIGWRQSRTTGETLPTMVVVMQFAWAHNGIFAGADPELDTMNTENDTEMNNEAEERKLHRMATVHDFLVMWQGSRSICATQKEYLAQNKQMTTVGCILDTEQIVNASWSLFRDDGGAAFKMSEGSPLPPPVYAKDLPGGRTQILNVHRIRRINHHPVESYEDSTPESISDTEDWLNCNVDWEKQNDSKDHSRADVESDIHKDNSIEDPDCPVQQDVSAAPDVPRLIWATRKSKRHGDKVVMTVNAIETRRNDGAKQK